MTDRLLIGSPAVMCLEPSLDPPDDDGYPLHPDGTPLTFEELDTENERARADFEPQLRSYD